MAGDHAQAWPSRRAPVRPVRLTLAGTSVGLDGTEVNWGALPGGYRGGARSDGWATILACLAGAIASDGGGGR